MTCSKPILYYPFWDSSPTPPPPSSSQIWINITYSYPYIQQFPPLFHNYFYIIRMNTNNTVNYDNVIDNVIDITIN